MATLAVSYSHGRLIPRLGAPFTVCSRLDNHRETLAAGGDRDEEEAMATPYLLGSCLRRDLLLSRGEGRSRGAGCGARAMEALLAGIDQPRKTLLRAKQVE